MTTTSRESRQTSRGPGRRWRDRWLSVHPPVVLLVNLSRSVTLQTITLAAKPSQQRLQLRDLFAAGRRYYIQPNKTGFRLRTNSRIPWRRKQRTPFSAEMIATLTPLADDITSIRLRVTTNWFYVLRGLFIPAWMSSIVVFMPYPLVMRAGLVTALFVFALLASRLSAALQATHLVYFVQKALEEVPQVSTPGLSPGQPDIIREPARAEFRRQWERFYAEHQDES